MQKFILQTWIIHNLPVAKKREFKKKLLHKNDRYSAECSTIIQTCAAIVISRKCNTYCSGQVEPRGTGRHLSPLPSRFWQNQKLNFYIPSKKLVNTGSAVRNWYKVKTWLDQMFSKIYKKLMLSGFLSSGILCMIHYLELFWPHAASAASVRKGAIYQWKIGFLMIHSTKNYQYWLFWCQWWSDYWD